MKTRTNVHADDPITVLGDKVTFEEVDEMI